MIAALSSLLPDVSSCFAQQAGQKTFESAGAAAVALYNAVKSSDDGALPGVLGPSVNDVIRTGDDVADKNARANFIRRYDEMHRVVIEPDQSATLYIGAENWPLPIPIVKNSSGAWYFDMDTGKKEILYRRIGTNENDAIDTLDALVDAQHDYASQPRDGDTTKHFAMKFISDEGKHNGLYWQTSDTEAPSPIGPLLVSAASEGYNMQQGKKAPYHGYYYHILTRQGPAAKGGAHDYMVNGKLTRGFAFVAYPAEYRNSGVMTFCVNQDGVVYQKNLGPDTATIAAAMTEYNPNNTWEPAE
ncbi:DUF2950 domain-containing protein [Alloacidobacterium dinghuense]|uniref:DUF2950 domain-containing protein n=1 Tax=Alloacidobacterium dinghuense TaxID=2763107 RepID=A0A7G8BQJ1_9BACT|nr:DUF2950 domain-containing protein [Alloacidobacterium dinghuense]